MLNTPEPQTSSPSTQQHTRTAATAGDAEAQFALAFSIAASPEPQDYAQAKQWYEKAADQNHRLAQFNLGQMFAHGQGVPKSDSMAEKWIRMAAEGGDAGAQFNLGERCAQVSAHGSEKDTAEARVECYKWFTLAAAQNYRNALAKSDSATMRMTREEVTEGNRRVKEFAPA
jgi:TPR repeat protein